MAFKSGAEEAQELAQKLSAISTGDNKWKACCPAHDDSNPSLTIGVGDKGKMVVKCWSGGCTFESIMRAADMPIGENKNGLSSPSKAKTTEHVSRQSIRDKLTASYEYKNANGSPAYLVKRFEFFNHHDGSPVIENGKRKKSFKQYRPNENGSGWIPGNKDCLKVPYKLIELITSTGPVFIVEGEKDVDRLASLEVVATCNAGGTGSTKQWHEEFFKKQFESRDVVIIPDNDEPGAKHSLSVAKALSGTAKSIRILNLPDLAEAGDVSDWLDAGNDISKLYQLAQECKEWENPDAEQGVKPQFRSVSQLRTEFPSLKPVLIESICRQGEVINVIAPPKAGKSWMVTDLALSIATGNPWLGRFDVEQGNVLILDNELHRETSAKRIPDVANARMIKPEEYENTLFVDNLRGRLIDVAQMQEYCLHIEPGQFKLIIIDALYRAIPFGESENDNRAMAEVYNICDKLASMTGASFVLIHHSTKGSQSGKAVTDVGAGAGSQSRAADTHLILRQHQEAGCVVLDGVVRSFPPIDPVGLRWDFPLWNVDSSLNAKDLQRPKKGQDEKQEQNDRETVASITDILSKADEPQSISAISKRSQFGRGRIERGVAIMSNDERLTESEMLHSNGKPYTVYSLNGGGTSGTF